MTTKKTVEKNKATDTKKEEEVTYIVTEDFRDSVANKVYLKGDVYKETSKERTEALLNAETSDLNKVGRAFIKEGK